MKYLKNKNILNFLLSSTCAAAVLLSALFTPLSAMMNQDDDEFFDAKPYTVPLGLSVLQSLSVQSQEEKVTSPKSTMVRDNKATNSQANFGEIQNVHLLKNITPSILVSLPEAEVDGILEKMSKAMLIVFSEKMDEEKSRLAADKKKKKELKAVSGIQGKLDKIIIDKLCDELSSKFSNLLSEDDILNFRSKIVAVIESKQRKQKPSDPSVSVGELWRLNIIENHFKQKYTR